MRTFLARHDIGRIDVVGLHGHTILHPPRERRTWQIGDALEAQAFAYLAVRSLDGLPLSFPGTTGVKAPMPGGRLYRGFKVH